jgi:hypothetical protein
MEAAEQIHSSDGCSGDSGQKIFERRTIAEVQEQTARSKQAERHDLMNHSGRLFH